MRNKVVDLYKGDIILLNSTHPDYFKVKKEPRGEVQVSGLTTARVVFYIDQDTPVTLTVTDGQFVKVSGLDKDDVLMRFTQEEVAFLKQALAIASNEYSKLFTIASELSNTPRNENRDVQHETLNLPFHSLAYKFSDLMQDIDGGKHNI